MERVDVERVLSRLGIDAKRKGKEWVALCPNKAHEDRSPSWRIRDEPGATKHGYHKCWPCGFQGGILSLVQHVLGLESYGDAKKWLGDEAPVEQKPVERVEVRISPPRLGFRLPAEVKFAAFDAWPSIIRDYVCKDRGLEAWQIDRWRMGYAVEGRLKGRVVIVSRDARGRPQRYTARSFTDSEKRYLEPEPEERANPSAMFGEEHWPPLGERPLVFVVEGAINGLALEAELPGVVIAATAGSDMRGLYATKLQTFERVCTMTDPDPAGDKLADDIATGLARHDTRVERLRLPEDTDQAALRKLRPGELGAIVRSWLGRR